MEEDFQDILDALKNLKFLKLVISDVPGLFTEPGFEMANFYLRLLISNSPLQSLSLRFEVLGAVPMAFLEPDPSLEVPAPNPLLTTLHTLSISGIAISPKPFMTLLAQNPLRRLSILNTTLAPGVLWRDFLTILRDQFSATLQNFHLAGMIVGWSADGEEVNWMLFPAYTDEWRPVVTPRNVRTKEIEDFVLRGGYWPMTASDALDFVLS